MFDRFSDNARKVMGLARQEAQRFNHEYIGTEHILLGLLMLNDEISRFLESLEIEPDRVRVEVEKIVQSGPSQVILGQLPFTPRAKAVLELTCKEAQEQGDVTITTTHMLLGLIRENEGVGAQVLMNMGLGLSRVRKLLKSVAESKDIQVKDTTGRAHFKDAHEDAIHALIDELKASNKRVAHLERRVAALESIFTLAYRKIHEE